MTNALDSLTLEEMEQITRKELPFKLPAETLLRLQDKVIEKLRTGGSARAATPAYGAYLEIKK